METSICQNKNDKHHVPTEFQETVIHHTQSRNNCVSESYPYSIYAQVLKEYTLEMFRKCVFWSCDTDFEYI